MNRIERTFSQLRREGKKALIAYLTVGFPSVKILPELVEALAEAGADLIELGVPFSDPLADGPTIQAASQWALSHGMTPEKVFRAVEELRRRNVELPLALMTYVNPVFRFGFDRFCLRCAASGVDGLIVPDLPPEEAQELIQSARPLGVDTIFLAAPTSPVERLKTVVRSSTGFIYYVSLTGVTGTRGHLPREISNQVGRLKKMTDLPVCVGFGISRVSQVREVVRVADGAIIGSALLEEIGQTRGNAAKAAYTFMRRMKEACRA